VKQLLHKEVQSDTEKIKLARSNYLLPLTQHIIPIVIQNSA